MKEEKTTLIAELCETLLIDFRLRFFELLLSIQLYSSLDLHNRNVSE